MCLVCIGSRRLHYSRHRDVKFVVFVVIFSTFAKVIKWLTLLPLTLFVALARPRERLFGAIARLSYVDARCVPSER